MSESKCPFAGHSGTSTLAKGANNRDWWPKQLNIGVLHQHAPASNPMDAGFDYRAEFAMLDYQALPVIDASDISALKAKTLATGLSVSDLVFVAWSKVMELDRFDIP